MRAIGISEPKFPAQIAPAGVGRTAHVARAGGGRGAAAALVREETRHTYSPEDGIPRVPVPLPRALAPRPRATTHRWPSDRVHAAGVAVLKPRKYQTDCAAFPKPRPRAAGFPPRNSRRPIPIGLARGRRSRRVGSLGGWCCAEFAWARAWDCFGMAKIFKLSRAEE